MGLKTEYPEISSDDCLECLPRAGFALESRIHAAIKATINKKLNAMETIESVLTKSATSTRDKTLAQKHVRPWFLEKQLQKKLGANGGSLAQSHPLRRAVAALTQQQPKT
ncbi:hypothetical protein BGZ65_010202 [Modicella reniformis]|uniref:Uncharacterized protein n=1 Tax=Modicella reniformis TaxID=1440133 RepID=A0A9P6II24_9FUNG|nr:hypothetical protein BGZ65_010202 [Modicella reniformis]